MLEIVRWISSAFRIKHKPLYNSKVQCELSPVSPDYAHSPLANTQTGHTALTKIFAFTKSSSLNTLPSDIYMTWSRPSFMLCYNIILLH